jgi:hypothetical protein
MLLMLLLLPIIQCHWRLVAEPPNARINPPPANGILPPTQGKSMKEMLSGGWVE